MIPVDLRADGVLWAINRLAFHPRGYALGFDPETGNFALLGDGTEVWSFDRDDEDREFAAFTALLSRAATAAPTEG